MNHVAVRRSIALLVALVPVAVAACASEDGAPGGTTGTTSTGSGTSTGTTSSAVQCSGAESRIEGLVVEDSVASTSGKPLAFVSLSSTPPIAGLPAATGADGTFVVTLPCDGATYQITTAKLGYLPGSFAVVPNRDVVPAELTMERQVGGYRFVPVAVFDYAKHTPLEGVRIDIDEAADLGAFYTDAAGLVSVPTEHGVYATHLAFSKQGYHPVSGSYSNDDTTWSEAQGVGRVVVTADGIKVKMVDAATASIPEPCAINEGKCLDTHTPQLCVDGDWAKQTKCPNDMPYCNAGACGVCSDAVRTCVDAKNIDICIDGVPAGVYCGELTCVQGECK